MKSGFVSIIGRPNVGKSTLLNAIINKKISIVSPKAQTTRNNIQGIYHGEDTQIVFVDTPGIYQAKVKLGQEMDKMAYSAMKDIDALVLVVDSSIPYSEQDEFLLSKLTNVTVPFFIVMNKIDLVNINQITKIKSIYQDRFPNAKLIETVANERFNVDALIKELEAVLPEGPAYYDQETITDQDEIFQIKEIIREKALRILKDEVPHAIAIYMNNIEWDEDPIDIRATIIVEKDSQKGIVIGKGGKMIKSIGTKARKDIEDLLGQHVYLELYVKVREDWRNQDSALKEFGYKNKK